MAPNYSRKMHEPRRRGAELWNYVKYVSFKISFHFPLDNTYILTSIFFLTVYGYYFCSHCYKCFHFYWLCCFHFCCFFYYFGYYYCSASFCSFLVIFIVSFIVICIINILVVTVVANVMFVLLFPIQVILSWWSYYIAIIFDFTANGVNE